MNRRIKIAIDGPAASGKSTTARLVAERLHYLYIDTGAMYRALTLAVINNSLDINDESAILALARESNIVLAADKGGIQTFLNGKNVSEEIRLPQVTKIISVISAYKNVRQIMVEKQRNLAKDGGIVMEGRDIGTNVLPDAEIKVFMVAGLRERALRRFKEMESRGINISIEEIEQDIRQRDELDSTRLSAPLKPAADAIQIDTSNLTIADQVSQVLNLVRKYLNS
jgi:cytidylate kinase